jgi:hypothetical protein
MTVASMISGLIPSPGINVAGMTLRAACCIEILRGRPV